MLLFGCNSKFYYEFLSTLSIQPPAIDLIHAFVHKHEDGPEKWSLPVISKLSNRVVINQRTKTDLIKLYDEHHVPSHFSDRILCIYNYTETILTLPKLKSEKIIVLYVGRGSSEKRVDLIGRIAGLINKNNSTVEFHFIGKNLENIIAKKDQPFCIFHGEITDKNKINEFYKKAHLLLITSSREGFPMVVMEGMMHGVVPISTNVGGISEHVKNNINGILINALETDEIINEIVNHITHLTESLNELSILSLNATSYAQTHFEKRRFVESYRKILCP